MKNNSYVLKFWLKCLISKIFSLTRHQPVGNRTFIYHSIGSNAFNDHLNLNSISQSRFLNHIETFKRLNVVDPANCDYNESSVSITFDDGYVDNYHFVSPILYELNFPYTIFVTTDYVLNYKECINKKQLEELSSIPNVKIGSHTKSHPDLTKLNIPRVKEEIYDSKNFIEDIIGKEVDTISYPYGKVNSRIAKIVNECGYKYGFCSHFSVNNSMRNPYFMNRCFIHKHDNTNILRQKLNGEWDWLSFNTDPFTL